MTDAPLGPPTEPAMVSVVPVAPPPPRPRFTRRQRFSFWAFIVLMVVLSGGSLLSSYLQNTSFQHAITSGHNQRVAQEAAAAAKQAQANALLAAKLCHSLNTLAALKPPASMPGTSTASQAGRVYEQQLAATLGELSGDVGCQK